MNKNVILNIIVKLLLLAISLSFIWVIEVFNSYLYIEKKIDAITNILNEDVQFFWRQKSNLNQMFQNAPIATDNDGFRIVPDAPSWDSSPNRVMVLGASPSFGWGVDNNQNYTALLQKKFNSLNKNDASVSFFNGSQIGYSSFQGLHLFQFELLKKKPTHLLISYLINDVDYYRFFRNSNFSDENVKEETDFLVYIRNFFRHLYTYKLIDQLLAQYSFNLETVESQFSDFEKRNIRVSNIEYERNLEKFINLSIKNKITPVFIKIPFGPSKNFLAEENIHDEKVNIINSVKNLYLSGYKSESMQKLEELKKINSYYIKKNSLIYANIMENIAKKYDISFIDISEKFTSSHEYLFIDPIYDNIHPNIKGHEIIADIVFQKLKIF